VEKLVTKYVWEWPVRITHWINALSILFLSLTGLYIGWGKTLAHDPSQYVMGWARFIHFVTGYIFTISVLSRLYWAFAGNEHASWRAFVPYLFRDGRRNMKETFLFYTFFRRAAPSCTGHNAMAGSVYLFIFLLFLLMTATGFTLYAEYAPGGIMNRTFGMLFAFAPNQVLRLIHHGGMWLIICFVINHVYSSWLMDVKEKNGVISSIFGGYKSVPEEERPCLR